MVFCTLRYFLEIGFEDTLYGQTQKLKQPVLSGKRSHMKFEVHVDSKVMMPIYSAKDSGQLFGEAYVFQACSMT